MPEGLYPPWWERWKGWWDSQQLFLQAADPQGRLHYLPERHCVEWHGSLVAVGQHWPVLVRWGPGTPYMPPAIVPVGCFSSFHQLRDLSMCLLRPEGLAAGYIGVRDTGFWLKRAVGWLEQFAQERWSIHPLDWMLLSTLLPEPGYRMRSRPLHIIALPPEWQEPLAAFGRFRVLLPKDRQGLGAISEWQHEIKGPKWKWPVARSLVKGAFEELSGVWLNFDITCDWSQFPYLLQGPRQQRTVKRLEARIREEALRKGGCYVRAMRLMSPDDSQLLSWGFQVIDLTREQEWTDILQALASFSEEHQPKAALLEFVGRFAQHLADELTDTSRNWMGIMIDNQLLDARRRTGRPDEVHRRIDSAQVLLVGLGALGSEVAHLLAQEGVKNFLLMDGDLLLPGNVARHRASLTDAGRPKVDAVKRDIHQINPSAQIETVNNWIDAQLPALQKSAQGQEELCVAVGLTGDESSEHALGEFCSHHRLHCVHAWMEMDGRVLRLFRVLSGKDPALLELSRDPDNSIPALPKSSALVSRPRECAEVVQPGSASNIHAAANFIARVVLDIISGRYEPENHWLFAPDGVPDGGEDIPPALRSRYGVVASQLPLGTSPLEQSPAVRTGPVGPS